MPTTTNNSTQTNNTPSASSSNSQTITPILQAQFEKHAFFTKEEISVFLRRYKDIILYRDDGAPYISYNIAKKVFESVVGYNYNLEILSFEYIHEFETYSVHLRITLCRDDKKIIKDVIGCSTATHKKGTNEVSNFKDLSKSAVKDGFRKFLSDYIGIGAEQFTEEKTIFENNKKAEKNKYSKNNQNNTTPGAALSCSDCGASINQKIYDYSTLYHVEKRALCPTCQKKY